MNYQKGIAPIVIAIIVALLAAGGGGMYYVVKKQQAKSVETGGEIQATTTVKADEVADDTKATDAVKTEPVDKTETQTEIKVETKTTVPATAAPVVKSSEAKPVPASPYKIYSDSQYGFQIEYPSSYVKASMGGQIGFPLLSQFMVGTRPDIPAVGVLVFNRQSYPVSQWVKVQRENNTRQCLPKQDCGYPGVTEEEFQRCLQDWSAKYGNLPQTPDSIVTSSFMVGDLVATKINVDPDPVCFQYDPSFPDRGSVNVGVESGAYTYIFSATKDKLNTEQINYILASFKLTK